MVENSIIPPTKNTSKGWRLIINHDSRGHGVAPPAKWLDVGSFADVIVPETAQLQPPAREVVYTNNKTEGWMEKTF